MKIISSEKEPQLISKIPTLEEAVSINRNCTYNYFTLTVCNIDPPKIELNK